MYLELYLISVFQNAFEVDAVEVVGVGLFQAVRNKFCGGLAGIMNAFAQHIVCGEYRSEDIARAVLALRNFFVQ